MSLEALGASIEKWERNAEAKYPDEYKTSDKDCPLCELYFKHGCQGCPVARFSDQKRCRGTPYVPASEARSKWFWADYDRRAAATIRKHKRAAHAAALVEVAFLKEVRAKFYPEFKEEKQK